MKSDVICGWSGGDDVDPTVEKVREVTLQRERDRQRQLQQIQVDRQIQNSKDLEAMENFRRTFYAKGRTIHPEKPPPLGIGITLMRLELNRELILDDQTC